MLRQELNQTGVKLKQMQEEREENARNLKQAIFT